MKKILIIGAGFGGLSAASLLAQAGHQVTILEKNEQPGGKASVYRDKGFVFDMGPSWYLIREVFQKFFSHFGKTEEDFYSLTRLDPSYRIFHGNADPVDISANLEKNLSLFNSLEKNGAEKLKKYLYVSQYKHETAMKRFLYRDYTSIADLLDFQLIKEGPSLHLTESIDSYTRRFFSNEFLRKILQYNIVFLGGSPQNTPALYSLMAHIDFNLGVYYPMGGLGSVAQAFTTVALKEGVTINYNQEVTSIPISDGIAHGVKTSDSTYSADVVLVNADYATAETRYLPLEYQTYPSRYWEKKTIAPSAFLIYLGLNKKIEKLAHHSLFLDPQWDLHFDSIFKTHEWPTQPSYYVCCPSKTDPTVAPPGFENLFILVPVAAGLNDSDEQRELYFSQILSNLESRVGEDIIPHIVTKRIFAHRDFSERYNAYKGTSLGLSHTLFQTALFRPQHRSKK